MTDWDGKERREGHIDLIFEVRQLSLRFDNELGAANGATEGSVKRHLRRIQEDVADMKNVMIGDGLDNLGMASKMRQVTKDLSEHKEWDKWLFTFIGGGQLISVILMLYGIFRV